MTADMDSVQGAESPAAGPIQAAEREACCTPRNCAPAVGGAHEGSPAACRAAPAPPSAPVGPPLLQAADEPPPATDMTGAAATPSQQPTGHASQQKAVQQQLQRTPLAEVQTPAGRPLPPHTSGGGSSSRKRKSTTPASAGQLRTGRSRRSSAASPQALAVPQAAEPGAARVTTEGSCASHAALGAKSSQARQCHHAHGTRRCLAGSMDAN